MRELTSDEAAVVLERLHAVLAAAQADDAPVNRADEAEPNGRMMICSARRHSHSIVAGGFELTS